MHDMKNSQPSAGKKRRTRRMALAAVAIVVVMTGMVAAQAQTAGQQSMEERLRAQLRATTTQLQQAQAELARLRAGGVAANGPAGDAASGDMQKELAEAKAQLAIERARARRLDAGQAGVRREAETIAAQSSQLRDSHAQLQKAAQTAEAERQRLATEAEKRNSAIQQCEAKNVQLYSLGKEVLHAYETVDFGTVLSTRQPFAAKARARYEQIAQEYGDRLYQGRFDKRAVETPAAAGSVPTSK